MGIGVRNKMEERQVKKKLYKDPYNIILEKKLYFILFEIIKYLK